MIAKKMISQETNIIVLKTDIQSLEKLASVSLVFDNHVGIRRWSVDMEDIDNVLRIEAIQHLTSRDVLELIYSCGCLGKEF